MSQNYYALKNMHEIFKLRTGIRVTGAIQFNKYRGVYRNCLRKVNMPDEPQKIIKKVKGNFESGDNTCHYVCQQLLPNHKRLDISFWLSQNSTFKSLTVGGDFISLAQSHSHSQYHSQKYSLFPFVRLFCYSLTLYNPQL